MSATGRKRTLAHQRFASLSPTTTAPGWLDHPVFDENFDSLFPGPDTLVIHPFLLPNVLRTHQGQGAKQSSLVIDHKLMLPRSDKPSNIRYWWKADGASVDSRWIADDPIMRPPVQRHAFQHLGFGERPHLLLAEPV